MAPETKKAKLQLVAVHSHETEDLEDGKRTLKMIVIFIAIPLYVGLWDLLFWLAPFAVKALTTMVW